MTTGVAHPSNSEGRRWWAGIATVLPRGSLIPPRGSRLLRRLNEYRLGRARKAIFPDPRVPPDQARALARPTSTGLGDLLCAWMMPMAMSELNRWQLRIPVPASAGGLHHDLTRPPITPEWLHATFSLPALVRMVTAEAAPDDADWFCTLEQQWHLNSCMETSYDTIPWWLRGKVDRNEYYAAYQRVAGGLIQAQATAFYGGPDYYALHARRADRGKPSDDEALRDIVSALARGCSAWAVVSDDDQTANELRALLRAENCTVAQYSEPDVGLAGQHQADRYVRLIGDFKTLVGAQAVVCSVRGGWSAFPYAATRVSGAPLVFTEALERSIIWRVIRAHSKVPVRGVHHGPAGVAAFVTR